MLAIVSFCIVLPLTVVTMQQPTFINVPAGGDLQAAINNAVSLVNGGTSSVVIMLEENKDYACDCVLPEKQAGLITIESSGTGRIVGRAGPQSASLMARVRSVNSAVSTFATRARANNYKFRGLDIGPKPGGQSFSIVSFGTSGADQDTLAEQPFNLTIEKSWIHPEIDQECQRGLALNSGKADIIDSTIEAHGAGYDTQAVVGWNGTGPYNITNSLLMAPGETIMFGGADPSIPNLVTTDVTVRRSHIFKPQSWNPFNKDEFRPLGGQAVTWTTVPSGGESRPRFVDSTGRLAKHWTNKNNVEAKSVRRWLIDGSIIEGNWADAQTGAIIVLKTANQDGKCTWCVSEEITISNSIIRNSDAGLSILGRDGTNIAFDANRLRLINNLWINVRGKWIEGLNGAFDVTIDHNTQITDAAKVSHAINLYDRQSTGFVATNNIHLHGTWGIKGGGMGEGTEALNGYTPGAIYRSNILAGAKVNWDGSPLDWTRVYPINNFYPTSYDGLFVDAANGNYRLAPGSIGKNAGTDGKDIGVDMDQLEAAMSGSGPTPTPTPTPTASPSPTPTATPTPTPSPSPTPAPTPTQLDRIEAKVDAILRILQTPSPTPMPTPSPTPKPKPGQRITIKRE